MRRKHKASPGSLRWFAAGSLAVIAVLWLGSAFLLEATATCSLGMLWLRSGCVQVVVVAQDPPPGVQVTQRMVWPPDSERGIDFKEPRRRWVQWLPVSRVAMATAGSTTSSGGPNPVWTVAAASVQRITVIPLWPLVLLVGAVTVVSWRRHFLRGPGQCPRCGYDRRGLAVDAKCPECGTVPTLPTK